MWDLPGPRIESMFPAMTSGFFTTKPPGKPWIACWRESSMCFIHLCRLFTTQSFDFSGSNLPGANLLLTQQPAQLTLTSLKTCQWVSTQQMINSPTYEFSKSALAYWGTPPALVFTSDTLSFALSMQFLLPQATILLGTPHFYWSCPYLKCWYFIHYGL